MAITPLNTVDEFCTGGDKTAYAPSKLVTGYTGSENDPAFAENINSQFNILTASVTQHATIVNDEIVPEVEKIPDIEALGERNEFPVFTAFPYLSDLTNLPAGWAACQGQTFNQTTYPLLYAANGSSNALPDLRGYAAIGSTASAPLSFTNGAILQHNHSAGTLYADNVGDHVHGIAVRANYSTVNVGTGTNNLWQAEVASITGYAGAHGHNISGVTGSSAATAGNIPKSFTCHWIVKLE